MGDAKNGDPRVGCDSRTKLKFLGRQFTTDAGLLAYRQVNDALRLTYASRFEAEQLDIQNNRTALLNLWGWWIDRVHQLKPLQELILNLDRWVSEPYGRSKA